MDNSGNQGPTWGPTAPRLTTNMRKTVEEDQEAALNLYQAIYLVIFHQDAPAFSFRAPLRGDGCPVLPARYDTTHVAPALSETAAPDPATLKDVRSGKKHSNRTRPVDGQTTSPSPPDNQDSDSTSVASIGESDGNSNYVNFTKNAPTSSAKTLDSQDTSKKWRK